LNEFHEEIPPMDDNTQEEEDAKNSLMSALDDSQLLEKKLSELPSSLYVVPLLRRPFFPGMAAPLVLEPGPYYDLLKVVAKSEHKCVALVLTHEEDVDIYKVKSDDLYKTGVLARVLRIIPMEQGGAQVILNMEKRVTITRSLKDKRFLKAKVKYHEDPNLENSQILPLRSLRRPARNCKRS